MKETKRRVSFKSTFLVLSDGLNRGRGWGRRQWRWSGRLTSHVQTRQRRKPRKARWSKNINRSHDVLNERSKCKQAFCFFFFHFKPLCLFVFCILIETKNQSKRTLIVQLRHETSLDPTVIRSNILFDRPPINTKIFSTTWFTFMNLVRPLLQTLRNAPKCY